MINRIARQALFSGTPRKFFSQQFATPKLVKELRAMTGSPLKDCMKALEETQGDMEASKEYLRKKGLAEAEKRVDRLAAQGLVGVFRDDAQSTLTMIQLACETDFVAKTENFQQGLQRILQSVHHAQNFNSILGEQTKDPDFIKDLISSTNLVTPLDDGVTSQSIEEGIKYVIAKTQENCQLVKIMKLKWNPDEGDVLQAYIHSQTSKDSGMGKIGSVVHLTRQDKQAANSQELNKIASSLTMHIAAMKPAFKREADIPEIVK
jgi:elongation factor Ts